LCQFVESKNLEVQSALSDLHASLSQKSSVDTFVTSTPAVADLEALRQEYSRQCAVAIETAVRVALSKLHSMVAKADPTPLFVLDCDLSIPDVVFSPGVDETQRSLNRLVECVCSVLTKQHRESLPEDIKALIETLSRVVIEQRSGLEKQLLAFAQFEFLWRDDKRETHSTFMSQSPSLEDFETELRRFAAIETEIRDIPNVVQVNGLWVEARAIKESLRLETARWKSQYEW